MKTKKEQTKEQITKVVFVTPQMAEEWLESNVHNRDIEQSRVERFSEDMREGKWRLNNQGIGFDVLGRLADGQHRLYAIWLSGEADKKFKGVNINVTYNMSEDAQSTVDIGKNRNQADIIILKNPELAVQGFNKKFAATAKAMAGGLNGRRNMLVRNSEMEDFVKKHFAALAFAERVCNYKIKGTASASFKAVIARAFYTQDHERLERFATVVANGFMATGEEAAIALKNTLASSSYTTNSDAAGMEVYSRTETALAAFIKRRSLKNKPNPTATELYPLEIEPVAVKREATRKVNSPQYTTALAKIREKRRTMLVASVKNTQSEAIAAPVAAAPKYKIIKGGSRAKTTQATK